MRAGCAITMLVGCASHAPAVATKPVEDCGNRIQIPHGLATGQHLGTDFAVCTGEHVVAVGDGVVDMVFLSNGTDSERGDALILSVDGADVQFMYSHLSRISVVAGQAVRRGDRIAEVWTPVSFPWNPHVHLAVLTQGTSREAQDPLRYLRACRSQATPGALIYPVSC